jgi:hypothetical protein
MSDVFREVDEELRRSQAEAVWKKYGVLIVAGAVLLVVGVGGYRFYEWQRERSAAASGARFDEALRLFQENKAQDAEAALQKIIAEERGAYRVLAQLRAAAELTARDRPGALALYGQIAADASAEQALRDLARLRAGAIMVDTAPLAEVEAQLQPLAGGSGVWRHTALELLAGAALRANDSQKALHYLDQIVIDAQAPQSLKARAELLMGLARSRSAQ